jgi:hypothetical protein
MIRIRQTIVPRSRTHTGSLWEATAEIGGKSYSAVSRHGAPQALARVLIATGIEDQPVEVCSEVCVFDNGAEIRTEELRGCIRYRSLHTMAKTTFAESATVTLRRARYQEQPEGLFLGGRTGQKMRFSPGHDLAEAPAADTQKNGTPAPAAEMRFSATADGQECASSPVPDGIPPADEREALAAEMRRCDGCDSDFIPARPWSRFCSPACRLRAHRRLAG